jgi:cysteinyl-tRNA synthetase
MASEAFSKSLGITNIDIHAGGVDLKFPHHDNEIAQSEAYHGTHRWVNYWLHTGHLHIDGSKMSKSLKNFKTIREILSFYSARQLRLFFLLHRYNAPLEYSEDGLRQAIDIDKIFMEFFSNIKVELRYLGHIGKTTQHLNENDSSLFTIIKKVKKDIHVALSDDFDTPTAMAILKELIREYNKRVTNHGLASITIHSLLTTVNSILKVFGMSQFYSDNGGDEGKSKEEMLKPILNEVISFRQKVRKAAKDLMKPSTEQDTTTTGEGGSSGEKKKKDGNILSISDQVRASFFKLGIKIEDLDEDNSVWKLLDPADIEIELKQKQLEEETKLKQRELASQKAAEKLEQSKINPNEMFRNQQQPYSEFDEEGIPTKDKEGNPLSGAAIKKLKKEHAAQVKLHQKYLETLGK